MNNSIEVDKIISAEIPDEMSSPRLFVIVKQFMIHRPCRNDNLTSPCMNNDNKKCSKHFPMSFNEETNYNSTAYPAVYRRRSDGKEFIIEPLPIITNLPIIDYLCHIIPYLLLKLNCQINVEICSTVKCVKYLSFKILL